jgi:hypothetical protein
MGFCWVFIGFLLGFCWVLLFFLSPLSVPLSVPACAFMICSSRQRRCVSSTEEVKMMHIEPLSQQLPRCLFFSAPLCAPALALSVPPPPSSSSPLGGGVRAARASRRIATKVTGRCSESHTMRDSDSPSGRENPLLAASSIVLWALALSPVAPVV